MYKTYSKIKDFKISSVFFFGLVYIFFPVHSHKCDVDTSEFKGVIIGVSTGTLYRINNNISTAIGNRAISLAYGLNKKISNVNIFDIQDSSNLYLLSQKYSHMIVFEWGDKIIYHVCDPTRYKALRSFKHLSVHTIEPSFKLSDNDPSSIYSDPCSNLDHLNSLEKFRLSLQKFDVILIGLKIQLKKYEDKLNLSNDTVLKVRYVPVSVPQYLWNLKSKSKKDIRIFFDWDNRMKDKKHFLISKVGSAKIILKSIEIFRKLIEPRFGLELITAQSLPIKIGHFILYSKYYKS